MIHTINSQMWGTGLFAQRVALPHSAVIFKAFVNQTKSPGRALLLIFSRYFFQNRELHTSSPSSYGSLSCRLMLDSKMNPKETTESPTFLLPSFSDFFQAVPLQQFSLDGKVRNEVRDMGQGVTLVDYLKAYGPIGLGVALTIDDDEEMYGFTHPRRSVIQIRFNPGGNAMYGSVQNRVRVLESQGSLYITTSTHPLRGVPSFYLNKHSSVIDTDHLNSTTFVRLHCYYSIIIRNL